jgi:saccharopine dehydrogenase (NAD+, L-lysine-forming)
MRILVLGGGGGEGRELAKGFAATGDVSKVIVADRRKELAEKVAVELGEKGLAKVIDINDTERLINLIKECDLVENCVGPYYRFGAKVLRAAIQAKKNYADICDDPWPMLEMFELDAMAKEAGITALTGMGSSPGLSNLLCKYLGDKLDRVDKIHMYWCVHLAVSGGGVGAGLHGWRMLTGMVPQFLNGKLERVPAGSAAEMVEFPDGTAECYYLGHPEPVMMPRYFENIKEVTQKGTMVPTWATQDILKLIELGFGNNEPQTIKRDTIIVPSEVGLTMHSRYLESKREELGKPWSGHKFEVIGEKDGETVIYSVTRRKGSPYEGGKMELLTAVPARIGALTLARGEIDKKGVVTPEETINAARFIARVTDEVGEPFALTKTVITTSELKG